MLQLSFNDDDLGWHSCAVQHPPSRHQHPLQAQQHMSPVIVISALHNDGQVQFLPANGDTADPRTEAIETTESGPYFLV